MEITDNLKASIDRKLISCGLFLDFLVTVNTKENAIREKWQFSSFFILP